MSAASRELARRADRARQQSYTATFLRMSGAFAVVRLQGAEVAVPTAGVVQPIPNSTVQVELRESGYVMLGPVVPPPTRGRVTATGTPLVTVLAGGVSYDLPFMSAYTPTVDDDVAIEWSEAGGLVKGRVSTTPAAAPVVVPPAPVDGYHPSPFVATHAGYHVLSTGGYNGAWFPNYGIGQASAAWYGTSVADTIPDDAAVVSARLYLSTRSQAFGGPKLQVIEGSGPRSRVVVGGDFVVPARTGWVDIPVAVVDLLKVAPRGISLVGATSPSGSDVYNKLSADPQSFALDVSWSVGAVLAT